MWEVKDPCAFRDDQFEGEATRAIYSQNCNDSVATAEGTLTVSLPVLLFQNYLSDKHFQKLLGVSRVEFETLPKWRQSELKKKAGLF